MRLSATILALVSFTAVGCATSPPKTETDSSGLVRIPSKPGGLFAHPSRSIDDYDDILLGNVDVFYAPKQAPLSEPDAQRVRKMAREVVVMQIPAAGQLAAFGPGPCTVMLGVQLTALEFPPPGSRQNGGTTVILEFRDSLSGDPLVRYSQHRELSIGPSAEEGGLELERLKGTLAIVATDLRLNFRDALPLNATGARAVQGCKGTIGQVRKAAKEAKGGK